VNGSDEVYADCIHLKCPYCFAEPDVKCRNTITGRLMPTAHYGRIQAAGKVS
jgi:hypothetical protein